MLAKIKRAAGRFPSDSRGGATSIAAVGATIMALGGAALLIEHNQLYGQYDILKSAADAAALSAKLESGSLPAGMSDADVLHHITPIARKYAVLNVLANISDQGIAASDIGVTFEIDRGAQTLNAKVEANSGETLMASWLYDYLGPGAIAARSGVEVTEANIEIVFAIDTSRSMNESLDGTDSAAGYDSRLSIVKRAAISLVNTLQPVNGGTSAVGVVPWDIEVSLDGTDRAGWTADGWAVYPNRRHYAATYQCKPWQTCSATAATHNLPAAAPATWLGCLDQHRVSGGLASLTPDSQWFDPPSDLPFAQAIYPAYYGRAYDCVRAPAPSDFSFQECYGADFDSLSLVLGGIAPQACTGKSEILPLSQDEPAITHHIGGLGAMGIGRNSGLGVLWGQRLLAATWRDTWGHAVHPLDQAGDVRKVIVLVTDGDDSQCGSGDPDCARSDVGYSRATACTAAKAAGAEIFVVAAVAPALVPDSLRTALTACSSEGDQPGTYVFNNNDTEADVTAAFVAIANRLRSVRRMY